MSAAGLERRIAQLEDIKPIKELRVSECLRVRLLIMLSPLKGAHQRLAHLGSIVAESFFGRDRQHDTIG